MAKFKLVYYFSYAIALNLYTFVLYIYDKSMSKISGSRVPENILHFLSLIGGSPLAYIGQKVLHHKVNKESFQKRFRGILLIQFSLSLLGIASIVLFA